MSVESLLKLSYFLLADYKVVMLIQFDKNKISTVDQQILTALYPLSIIDNKIRVNNLYNYHESKKFEINNNYFNNIIIIDLPVYETNCQDDITACNPAFTKLSGYTIEDLHFSKSSDIVTGRRTILSEICSQMKTPGDSHFSLDRFQTL